MGTRPEGGRFRSFLLTAFNRFLANEYDRQTAAKRGGRQTLISLNQAEAEQRYTHQPVTNETPKKIFDRRWALAVLDEALTRLGDEARSAGRTEHFDSLSAFLSREASPGAEAREVLKKSSQPVAKVAN